MAGHPRNGAPGPGLKLCNQSYQTSRLRLGPCFFVLCNRHWFNRVPGAHRGECLCLPFTLTLTLVMPIYP